MRMVADAVSGGPRGAQGELALALNLFALRLAPDFQGGRA
jgi:hypothetical protein